MDPTNLYCYRGENKEWTITATRNSTAVDLTGAVVTMSARRNYASPVLFELTSEPSGGIDIQTPETAGIAIAELRTADTSGLSNQLHTLVYDVHVVTSAGKRWLVAYGALEVRPIAADLA